MLLQNLGGQGWDVEALGRAAVKAGIGSVVDILTEFCQDEGKKWLPSKLRAHLYSFMTEFMQEEKQ